MQFKVLNLVLFIIFLSFSSYASKTMTIRHKESGKVKEIKVGDFIYYKLKSDSVLGVELQEDYGKIGWLSDSSAFLKSGEELLFSDIKQIRKLSKTHKVLKIVGLPFIVVGTAYMFRGAVMGSLEGLERDNKKMVPMFAAGGALAAGLGLLPYIIKPKLYDLSNGTYEIVY